MKSTLIACGLVILTVGLVVALILPASQEAREVARSSSVRDLDAEVGSLVERESVVRYVGAAAKHAPADGPSGLPVGGAVPATDVNRKIIYQADVDLVVEDFSGVPEKVVELVKRFDGYVADSSLTGASGDSRRSTWKLRVPVARFEEFVNSAKTLGELRSASTTSQDVSEEYYDVDARIRNKTKEEERLVKLLEERPGKLEDVIAIERELSRVREELERMQGRMRVLADLTSMTTVRLTVSEIRNYEPPQTAGLPTRIRRAFEGSLTALQSAGEAALVAVVALVPWLAVLGLAAGGCYLVALRWLRHASARHLPDQA